MTKIDDVSEKTEEKGKGDAQDSKMKEKSGELRYTAQGTRHVEQSG